MKKEPKPQEQDPINKEPQQPMPTKERLKQLFDGGFPVSEAHFHSAVNNIDKVPENYFSDTSQSPNRRVEMSLVTTILLFKQKDRYFFTPFANVKFGVFKV